MKVLVVFYSTYGHVYKKGKHVAGIASKLAV